MAGDGQRFCLKWNDFRNSVTAVFEDLRQDEELVDITLCCEGKKVKAHRMMLSACSPYFRDLLKENPCQHPVFFLKDTTYSDLRAVIEFVYNGEVNVTQAQLSSFLKTAEMLQVRGLTGDDEKDSAPAPASPRVPRPPPPAAPRSFPRPTPAPAPLPASRQLPAPVRRPLVPTGPPHPPPPPPPTNNLSAAAPRLAESPPASPATKRRRRLSGSGSSSNDGLEPSSSSAPAASPAATPPAAVDGAPPPPLPAAAGPASAPRPPALEGAPPTDAAAGPSFGQSGTVKVEKIDIDIADDEDDLAALGQVVDYEGSYDSNQSLGSLPVTDASQVGGMFAAAGPSDGSGSGSAGSRESASGGSDARRHSCHVCHKCYGSREALSNHMTLHRGLTTCHLCRKCFATTSARNKHVRIVHGRRPGAVLLPPGVDDPATARVDVNEWPSLHDSALE